jgi:macrodomain Ter protein organizer (MatP/YcbG family)
MMMAAKFDVQHERTMACVGKTAATDLEANPEEAVRRVGPKENVAKSSGALKKRHRGRHLAAERRQKQKEWIQGNFGSWKKLPTTGRKMYTSGTVQGTRRQEESDKGQCGHRNPKG